MAENKVKTISIENEYTQYTIAGNGTNLHFFDTQAGTDYCAQEPRRSSFARVKQAGQEFNVTTASYTNGRITACFGESGVSAVIGVIVKKRYFTMEVLSVTGEHVEELVFVDLSLTVQGTPEEPFAACALALNLKTNVPELPRANRRLRAMCYPGFGLMGAKVAIIGCPRSELRRVMQEVVSDAEDLPHSSIGGPWALDMSINRGSYLFNTQGGLAEEKVGDWIQLAQRLGTNQLDFHGGISFRFGDCRPNPETYPRGLVNLKAVTDKLHEAGILAGLHTYAFFIDKSCPWVTPVPDPRLGKDAMFTLAAPLSAAAVHVPVVEPTRNMSAHTGFFVRNSVTLQIDDELITYQSISFQAPYAFTECRRGACGTLAAPHASGAPVHHLKECFGLFAPAGDSTLLAEVAAKTAEAFNEGGFDMIYLDALDGEDVLGGPENGWHYGSKFVFEIWKRLKKPALMEMSTFHHHLWFVRSRLGAWDYPLRSHKKFIDLHCASNEECRHMFLPALLGWWAFQTWSGPQAEPTFPDDIEYLCCKALATDTGLAITRIDPSSIATTPALSRLAAVMKQYEDLRHAKYFPKSVTAKLGVPGDEFTLAHSSDGKWQLKPIQYARHKVEGINGWSNLWQTRNKFGRQPLQLRIEALMSAGPYDAPENVTLAEAGGREDFPDRTAAKGISVDFQLSATPIPVPPVKVKWPACWRYTAMNSRSENELAAEARAEKFSPLEHGIRHFSAPASLWTKVGKTFLPLLDLDQHQALGVWVYGDGQGEVLNLQLRNPQHIGRALGDHYVIVDFTGWRYVELIEPEGERYDHYAWPCGEQSLAHLTRSVEQYDHYAWPYGEDVYSIYRSSVNYKHVQSLNLWYNNIGPRKQVACCLSPIRALPLVQTELGNPTVTIGGKTVVFPTDIASGCYLEFRSLSDCKLYGPQGALLGEVKPQGDVPLLEAGNNQIRFACDGPAGTSARANVTVIGQDNGR